MSREEIATIAGGCFWCLEAIFKEVEGVQQVLSGYTGGHQENPTYEQVCSDKTGHAEAIQITFFPEVISFREILEIFFTIHDPTQMNRQGPDIGSQYRSAIFYHNQTQKVVAEQLIKELNSTRTFSSPVVTQVKPYEKFFSAEQYHRDYFERNPLQPYCQAIINPKIIKFRKTWENKLKKLSSTNI